MYYVCYHKITVSQQFESVFWLNTARPLGASAVLLRENATPNMKTGMTTPFSLLFLSRRSFGKLVPPTY